MVCSPDGRFNNVVRSAFDLSGIARRFCRGAAVGVPG